jgi:hypothetical protein
MVYLFQCSEGDRYALSVDKTGCNVPRVSGAWLLRGAVAPSELPDEFEPAIEHLLMHGFSLLKCEDDEPDLG